jgi:hypothetical protein
MVRIDIVRDKIRRLRGTLDLLRACLPADAAALVSDRDRLDLASFRVYLAMQEAVDLASHVIADQAWGPAPSLRDHFSSWHGASEKAKTSEFAINHIQDSAAA